MNNAYQYENLKVGMEIKNYKELCGILGAKVGNTNSKKAQFKDWECHFNYVKQGHKFIITEIYDTPKEKVENRGGANNNTKYVEHIEKLILDLLILNGKDNYLFISKNKLLKELKMINDNYAKHKYKTFRLSKISKISKYEIDEFFNSTDGMLERNLEKALDNLRSRALIIWNQALTIGRVETIAPINRELNLSATKREVMDVYGDISIEFGLPEVSYNVVHTKADEYEKQYILDVEHEVLIEMNASSIHHIFKRGQHNKFYKKVYDRLFNELNIYTYYNSYEITFNKETVENTVDDIDSLKLIEKEKRETQSKLNNEIKIQISKNAESRHNKAIEVSSSVSEDVLDMKYKVRKEVEYLNNNTYLINLVIDTVAN